MDNGGGGLPWVDFFIRILKAFVQILIKWPEGEGNPTPAEIIVLLFGETIADRFESILITITGIPELVDNLDGFLRVSEILLVFAMFVYGAYYWKSYMDASKSREKADAIDEDRTVMLPPHKWTFQRLIPVLIIGVAFFELLLFMLNSTWSVLTWFVEFVYTGSGTTLGDSFESLLLDIAGIEGMGIPFFIVLLVVMLIITVYFLWNFLDWVFHLGAAFFVSAVDLAKLLKGDKRTNFAGPFLVFIEQLARVALAVILLYFAPLVALGIQSWSGNILVGFFVMTSFLYWSVSVPKLVFGWRKLSDKWATAGSWVDEGTALTQEMPLNNLVGRTRGYVWGRVPDSYKQMMEAGWQVAKLEPHVAAVAAGAGAIKLARRDPAFVASRVQKAIAKPARSTAMVSPPSSSAVGHQQSSRTDVLATTVATSPLLSKMLTEGGISPSSSSDLALLFKLSSHFHSGPPAEPITEIKARFRDQIGSMSQEDRLALARLGKDIARETLSKLGRRVGTEWL